MTRHSPSTYAYLAPIQWFIGFEYVLTHIWIIAHHITLRSMHDLKVHRVRLTPDGFGRHSASIICVTSLAAEKSSVHEERPSQKKKNKIDHVASALLVHQPRQRWREMKKRRALSGHQSAVVGVSYTTPNSSSAHEPTDFFHFRYLFFFSYFVFRTPPS